MEYLSLVNEHSTVLLKTIALAVPTLIFLLVLYHGDGASGIKRSISAIRAVEQENIKWQREGFFLEAQPSDSSLKAACIQEADSDLWICSGKKLKKDALMGKSEISFRTSDGFNLLLQTYLSQRSELANATQGWWWWILAVPDWKEIHALTFAGMFRLREDDSILIRKTLSAYRETQGEAKFLLAMILGSALESRQVNALRTGWRSWGDRIKVAAISKLTGVPLRIDDFLKNSSTDYAKANMTAEIPQPVAIVQINLATQVDTATVAELRNIRSSILSVRKEIDGIASRTIEILDKIPTKMKVKLPVD